MRFSENKIYENTTQKVYPKKKIKTKEKNKDINNIITSIKNFKDNNKENIILYIKQFLKKLLGIKFNYISEILKQIFTLN